MPQGHVGNLVRQHSSELRLILRCLNQSRVDERGSAGKREGINRRIVDDLERITKPTSLRLLSEPLANAGNVALQKRIVNDLNLLLNLLGGLAA